MRGKITGLGATLLLFSFTVTALLIAAFILYIKFLPMPNLGLPAYMADMSDDSILTMLAKNTNEVPSVAINGFISRDSMETIYVSAMLQHLPYLLAFILFAFIVCALVLAKILHTRQEKQARLLASQLSRVGDHTENLRGHPEIKKAYADIQAQIDANTLDCMRLSAYVTHEQKNMLSLLRAKLQLSESQSLTDDVDKVVNSLDDILTLSASGKSTPMETIDAALVCAGVCDEHKKVYGDITFDFDDMANNQIISQALWLGRALSNLIHNAVKYAGGHIGVAVTNRNGSVIISVADEGGGISDAEAEQLFDYRYRVGRLKRNGYGIGLSLVRHVCDICGGLCWVERNKPTGTIFYMIFPEALTAD